MRGGSSTYEGEFRLRHKDGHYVHVLSRGFPIRREPGGPVVRIVGTHFDLTERKRAEAALRESEERLTLAFAGAQEGVWDWNLETGAVVYSPRWKQMLGYAEDEIEPHVSAWERLLHPDDRQRAREVNESVARGATTYEGEFRLRHKDGHYVHVLSRGFPVRREPGGPVVRIVGTHFDLTERKQADAERARTELLARLVFAQEDERRRIAREMHDQFGEQLTALGRGIGALKDACGEHARAARTGRSARSASRSSSTATSITWSGSCGRPRSTISGLRAALANYVQDWSKRVGISAELHTSGLLDDRLASEDRNDALSHRAGGADQRRQALARAEGRRHPRAARRSRPADRRGRWRRIRFRRCRARRGQGFGLLGMQERAALVGANARDRIDTGRRARRSSCRMAVGRRRPVTTDT